ncbi:hypothetical protein SAMN04488121_103393 [Chitinophaga filiformis]|uniref:Uncharacterized protein n=1 Tax=Chitinophaga filiformis TaxID=104663 RepID=A0A1G7RAI0_CHIFI|nr:hypothetical protein SAMN04488121_103393 [Chitinophaga filiformis]
MYTCLKLEQIGRFQADHSIVNELLTIDNKQKDNFILR